MEFDEQPLDPSRRKTLDEIRGEIDADYGYVELGGVVAPPSDSAEASDSGTDPLADGVDPRLVLGLRRDDNAGGGRRGRYALAALIGCVAGQAIFLMLLTLLGYGIRSKTPLENVAARGEQRMMPEASVRGDAIESRLSRETASSADELQTAQTPERRQLHVGASRRPSPKRHEINATDVAVSAARPSKTATAAASVPYPVPVRPEDIVGDKQRPEARAQVRSALDDWLRTLPGGDDVGRSPEPIIVLSADGRTARTYVSVASPMGVVPRVQRWRLGPDGWMLTEDRQAGVSTSQPPNTVRER